MIKTLQARREANEGGFTLIEMLIVIVILGILATIVLFATGQFTSDSKTAACSANVRIMQTAEAAYSAAHSGAGSNHGTDLTNYLTDPIPTSGSGAVHWSQSDGNWVCGA
jgi:prepilin-type N-terminal cleavage/methylation domain-containing protein